MSNEPTRFQLLVLLECSLDEAKNILEQVGDLQSVRDAHGGAMLQWMNGDSMHVLTDSVRSA